MGGWGWSASYMLGGRNPPPPLRSGFAPLKSSNGDSEWNPYTSPGLASPGSMFFTLHHLHMKMIPTARKPCGHGWAAATTKWPVVKAGFLAMEQLWYMDCARPRADDNNRPSVLWKTLRGQTNSWTCKAEKEFGERSHTTPSQLKYTEVTSV